jgi:4-aminobutyrate aminotransferase-like enzyme
VIRIATPLNISDEEIDTGFKRFEIAMKAFL